MRIETKTLVMALVSICLLGILSAPVMATPTDDIVQIVVNFDNELNSKMPDNVMQSSGYISIGVSKLYGNETSRYIGQVNASSLDPSREITSATLMLDRVSNTWDRDNEYYLCQIDEPWDTNNVTWNNQPNFGGTGVEGIYTNYGIFEFDFTNFVKDWVINPDSNNGFLIMKTYETGIENELNEREANRGSFVSINYSTAGGETRPYLEINYASQEMEPVSDLYARAKDTKVGLTWTLPNGAVSTNVYRDSDFLVSTTSTYATYLDQNVPPGEHTYMVRCTSVALKIQ